MTGCQDVHNAARTINHADVLNSRWEQVLRSGSKNARESHITRMSVRRVNTNSYAEDIEATSVVNCQLLPFAPSVLVLLGISFDSTREYFQVEQDYSLVDAGENAKYLLQ